MTRNFATLSLSVAMRTISPRRGWARRSTSRRRCAVCNATTTSQVYIPYIFMPPNNVNVKKSLFRLLCARLTSTVTHATLSDIWGLGCVLYEMCSLTPAFPSDADWVILFQSIVRGKYKPIPQVYSSSLSELVRVMLRPEPTRRPSAEQVRKKMFFSISVITLAEKRCQRLCPTVFS